MHPFRPFQLESVAMNKVNVTDQGKATDTQTEGTKEQQHFVKLRRYSTVHATQGHKRTKLPSMKTGVEVDLNEHQ